MHTKIIICPEASNESLNTLTEGASNSSYVPVFPPASFCTPANGNRQKSLLSSKITEYE